MGDTNGQGATTSVFFCQQLDPDQDINRRPLEKEFGPRIRFFSLPCSGRIDVLHLLKAIEAGADKVYLITCPEGACRYGQGNVRAKKRVAFARQLIEEIGLEGERIELVVSEGVLPLSIDGLVRGLLSGTPAMKSPQGQAGAAR